MASILRGSRSRISIAIFALLSIFVGLSFLVRDTVPSFSLSNIYNAKTRFDDEPPSSHPYGALVIAAQPYTDLKWTPLVEANWTIYPYDVTQPDNPDPRLRFPQSKGHEAMIYLSYIIDNYSHLPWSTIFIHGHRTDAWHQEDDIVTLISNLNLHALAHTGYISLRCDWFPSCPAEVTLNRHESVVSGYEADRKATEAAVTGNWRFLFPDERMPEALASQCCAQFAVTRKAILRRPRGDYERLREWLVGTGLTDGYSGRVFEKIWAYIFLGEAIHCPTPQMCSCEYFGRCETRNWTRSPETLEYDQLGLDPHQMPRMI